MDHRPATPASSATPAEVEREIAHARSGGMQLNELLDRAQSLAQLLSGQGIDPNRLVISTIDSKFPNSTDEAELAQDRIVRFTLLAVGGR